MNDSAFWDIIGEIPRINNNAICKIINNKIFEFDKTLKNKLFHSYNFPLLEVNFILLSYVSDEIFIEFRAWLILQGEEKFIDAISNPDNIGIWLNKDDIENILDDGRRLLDIPLICHLLRGGNEDDFNVNTFYKEDPCIEMNWAENKKEFRIKYPLLVDNFWNQDLINELH
jgi:hypothetical protein